MTERPAFGSLADVTVVDLTRMLAGPYATMMLADHGAHVIKVEPPEGDMTRWLGVRNGDDPTLGLGAYFQSVNRNKESVCIDLKSRAGAEAFRCLVKNADVVVESFRPGVMERLGLGYETLAALNPRIVYGALRGFGDGRTGSSQYGNWPAYDVVAQAMGGLLSATGTSPGSPTKVGPGIGDIVPGVMLAFGVLAAVHHARRTGRGQFVDVSMTDAVLAVCERIIWQHSVDGSVAEPEGNHHPFLCPFGIFKVVDGHVAIAAYTDDSFRELCAALEDSALAQDSRFATAERRKDHRATLITLLDARTGSYTKAQLAARLGGLVPFGPVMNIAEILSDPHFAARDMIATLRSDDVRPLQVAGVPIMMTLTPGGVRSAGPRLGQHSRAALAAAGLPQQDVDAILRDQPRPPGSESENGL